MLISDGSSDVCSSDLSEEGWLKLSRNWGVFFMLLAVLNEVLRRYLGFEDWLWAKIWVFLPLSFLFTFSQIPMLMRPGHKVVVEPESPDSGRPWCRAGVGTAGGTTGVAQP